MAKPVAVCDKTPPHKGHSLAVKSAQPVPAQCESPQNVQLLKYELEYRLLSTKDLNQALEPTAIGPILIGTLSAGTGKKLLWELGVLFGTINKTPDSTVKFNLEFEF